ncbi:hypothetical protein [Kingella potus]|uniref:hypothetical protein n=1 Tax=Kingella potus TaxID=265175 RepID=UPI001FD3B985|nr:hypothetical protein [Kingella potus]UOP01037.1 hypothetical protein LVJ84_01265 [Kingella potus]
MFAWEEMLHSSVRVPCLVPHMVFQTAFSLIIGLCFRYNAAVIFIFRRPSD